MSQFTSDFQISSLEDKTENLMIEIEKNDLDIQELKQRIIFSRKEAVIFLNKIFKGLKFIKKDFDEIFTSQIIEQIQDTNKQSFELDFSDLRCL